MNNLLAAVGGRRFLLAVGNSVITAFLLVLGYIDPGIYTTLVLATTGAYITANTTQKILTDEKGTSGEAE